jgi:hypothetical protein
MIAPQERKRDNPAKIGKNTKYLNTETRFAVTEVLGWQWRGNPARETHWPAGFARHRAGCLVWKLPAVSATNPAVAVRWEEGARGGRADQPVESQGIVGLEPCRASVVRQLRMIPMVQRTEPQRDGDPFRHFYLL